MTMVLQSGTEGPVLQAFSRISPEIVTELQDDPSLRRRGGGRGSGPGASVIGLRGLRFRNGRSVSSVGRSSRSAEGSRPSTEDRPDQRPDAPVTVRRRVAGPFAPHGPPVEAGHLRRDAGLVEEDDPGRITDLGPLPPRFPLGGDVLAVLLGGPQRLFSYVSPMRRSVLSTVAMVQRRRQAEAISESVAPG